ncbi:MAG: hypothetical protein HYZ20_05005, partial [Burkholderiales bacterium]|nr:hypothetical protein [Burkholderiales bacterium]
TATLLMNGNVLVAGGRSNAGTITSCELYNPTTGIFTATGSLATSRFLHTANLLPDGRVLVTGGMSGSTTLQSAELYDPGTGLWTTISNMVAARYQHVATQLPNGRLLLTGGSGSTGAALSSTELFSGSGAAVPAARPAITTAPANISAGQSMTLQGGRFRGVSTSSGGGTQDSPGDNPVPSLTASDGGVIYLRGLDFASAADGGGGQVTTSVPCSVGLGTYGLAVTANGIPSTGNSINVVGLAQGAACSCASACQGIPPNTQCYGTVGNCTAGTCSYPALDAGTVCNDGNACTRTDGCNGAGTCSGIPYTCTPNQCQASSTCNGTGGCNVVNLAAGTTCNDANACTSSDVCNGTGNCSGTPMVCNTAPAPTCLNPTTSRVYNTQGTCSAGTCNYTYNDVNCSPGTCQGATGLCNIDPCAGVSCTTPPNTDCFTAPGTCSFGACQYPQRPVGTTCNDGKTCTTGD